MKTIQELVLELEKLSEAYYAGDELVSDITFDALEEELRQADPNNAWFKRNRESVSGGFGVKFPHPYQFIGSIDKIHSIEESKILNASYCVLSAKLDGTSLVTYFTNGKLDRALTRGDGYFGLDVTDKFLKIVEKYQWQIPQNFTGAIRGEVVFSLDNWEKFKALHPEAKAPRNSGTGLINNKIASDDLSFVDYVVYDIVATNDASYADYWVLLAQFGLPLAQRKYLKLDYVSLTHDDLLSIYSMWSKVYPLDGLVIRPVFGIDLTSGLSTGIYYYTGNKEAYKFQAETKIVEVIDVIWQMGRTGKLTPVVKIPPTELSGAIVQNVTAHNAALVRDNHIGVGAVVSLYRSGEVIPKLHEFLRPGITNIPLLCPHCNSMLQWTDSRKDLVCVNAVCPELRKLAVYKYIESMCKDIKGLGDVFLENFVSEIRATSILTLLQNAESWGSKSFVTLGNADNKVAAKVLEALSVKAINPELFLVGLGIPLLGTTFSKELADDTPALKAVFNAILDWYDTGEPHGTSSPDWEVYDSVIQKLSGRNALANNVLDAVKEVKDILLFIQSRGGSFAFKSETAQTTAKGTYCITGSLSKGRKEIEAEFAEAGWQMVDSIRKGIVCLINNDNTSSSSKNLKAQAAGIPILTEAEFRAKYL